MPHQPWTARIILRQMADNLIFPIGFDLEKGVADAQKQMDAALKRLQKTADSRPLTIPMSLDASKFTTFEAALRGSIQHITDDAKNLKAALDNSLQTDNSANINRITEAMRNLEAAWKALPNNQKFDINDRLTPKAQEMVRQFNELATASSTYGQTLSQIAGKIKRAAEEEAKANQKRNDGYAKLRKTLGAQENSIANLSAKIKAYQQILNSKEVGSKSFERVAEKIRKLTKQLGKAKEKVAELTGQTQSGAARQSAAVRQVSNEFKNQETYVSRLLKRMAVYASFSYTGNFLTNVREVTAQFELQRVSLGAILQSQEKANQLFSEIKAFALKSPVSILDLTKYTKQLAAYKIGYDELFETTKKLTDVSVGLGVSMDRVVLAYGQVRATGYLRASEVRQFTEMGVPIVEELAAKLEKLNGEAVTAADVMELISKRGISFEMVKDVFNDMTSAGGIFYNMQEKQGNTLYGMWAKLGDAASVMYEQIGNTGVVNQGMRLFIQSLTDLMRHWRVWGNLLMWAGGLYLANAGALKLVKLSVERYSAAGLKNIAVSKAKIFSAQRELIATRNANVAAKLGARMDLAVAATKLKAATATNVFSASLYRLWAAFLANPLGWVIGIVGTLVALFYDADDSAKQFAGTLSEIEEKYTLKNLNDADNFKRLADGALKAAAGSKEQREKLEELDRTYGKIVGSENLQIDKLRAMNGEYGSLIETIKEYNIQMKYSEREGAIKEFYGGKKKEAFGDFEDELSTIGFGSDEVGHEAGATIAINIQDALLEELEKNGKATVDNAEKLLQKQLTNVFVARGKSQQEAERWASTIIWRLSSETEAYVEALNSERNALDANSDAAEKASGKLGALRKEIKEAKEELDKINYVDNEGNAIDDDTFLYQQMVANETMKKAADLIRNSQEMKDALGDKAKELEPEWLHLVDSVNPNDLTNITTINFDAILGIIGDKYPDLKRRIKLIQEEWGNVAPTNATALQIRDKLIAVTNSFGLSMDKMKKYLWDGSGDVDAYLKRLKEQQDELKKRLKEKQNALLQMGKISKWWNKLMGRDIEAEVAQMEKEIAALDQQIAFTTEYTIPDDKNKNRGRGGTKSDPRLQNLKEEISLYEKLYQEYKQYEKAVGSSKAAEYMEREAKATIDALAKKYGIGLPKNVTDLTSALEILYKKMQALPSKVFKNLDKELKEFRWKIEKVDIDDSQKKIEAQIKELADKISRTKTAKEFYDKVLGMTGDYELAAKVSVSIYGDTGYDLQKQLAQQVRQYFQNDQVSIEIPVDVITDDNQINYKKLGEFAEKMKKELGEGPYKAIKKIAEEGQKDLAKTYEGYLKDLEKAQTYADKRIELARTTAEKIRKINADIAAGNIDEKVGKETIRGLQDKESIEAAKREYEAFKDTPLYVQMFEDLEHASTSTLEMMKRRLERLKGVWGTALDPTQLKDIQSRMNEIDEQLRTRNPFKTLKESYQQYRDAVKSVSLRGAVENAGAAAKELYDRTVDYGADSAQARDAQRELIAREKIVKIARQITAENKKGQKALDAAAQIANDNLKIARGHLDIASEEEKKAVAKAEKEGEDPAKDPGVLAAREKVEAAKEEVRLAERVAEITTNYAHEAKTWKESLSAAAETTFVYLNAASDLAHSIADLTEEFGGSEEDVQYWNDIGDALGNITAGAQDLIKNILDFNVAGMVSSIVTALPKMAIGFSQLFSAGKVKRANKEIKRQQKLLEQLEYTYGRLEAAADKAFGRDYVNNYNQQLKNLQAQQSAYLKQAEAERSKGKKADKDRIKEYEDQARDTADKIKELQDDLVAHFTGSSKTDVARQMANSWIEARASMSDTFVAIKGDYQDLIKNMIVEGAAARVIENALTPVWDSMQKMLDKNDVQGAIDSLISGMDAALTQANDGMEVLWKALEARGYDMKKLLGDTDSEYTGIAKSVAGATSEEINNVAAIGNTLMYYVSPIPRIDENLARVVAIMEAGGGASATTATTSAGWTDWQQQAMDNYQAIARNTADTVVRCERAAIACEKMARAITTKGATSGFNVFLNS